MPTPDMNFVEAAAQVEVAACAVFGVGDAMKVTTPESERMAAATIAQAKATLRDLDARRKALTDPLNQTVKKINAEYKAIVAPVEESVDRLSRAILDYRKGAERQEAEAYRARIAQEAKTAARAGDVSTLATLADAAYELERAAPKVVRTDAGNVAVRKVWKFRVVNPALVPDVFWQIDETIIREAVREGERKIPGVEIYEEEILTTRAF